MRKLFAWILTLSLLFSLTPGVYADNGATVQAGNEEVKLLQIQINHGGYLHSASVLRAEDGTVLAPLNWMTYYGGLKCKETLGVLQYYKPEQEELRNYAKRWIIAPSIGKYYVNWYFDTDMFAMFLMNADDFSLHEMTDLLMAAREEDRQAIIDRYFAQKNTKVKRMGTNYMPIHQGEFAKVLPYGGDYWVPLCELLSLLEITVGITNDKRILCMNPSQTTLFDVLYEHGEEIEELLFDSDDVVGNNFMAGTGWVVATFSGEIYNVVPSLGREIDYKEIFTSYLQDNEVYLSTFNSKNDSKASYYKKVADNFKDIKTIFQISARGHKPIYDMLLEGVTDPEFYYRYFEPAKKAGTAIDIAANAMYYIAAFANQVEDHRNMLGAVYDYEAEDHWPSTVAAKAVAATYESTSNLAVMGTIETTRKLTTDKLSEEIYKKAFGGWYYAIEATKVLCKEDYEYVVNSSKINLVSNTVLYAYDIFKERIYNRDLGEKGIDNVRLCLMMSLVGSRHAYKTYYKGDMMDKEVKKIDEILSKLYEVGVNRKENSINICQDRLKQYQKDLPELHLVKNDPVVLAETNMLLSALNDDNWKDGKFTAIDTDGDMHEEVLLVTETGTGLTKAEVDIDKNTVTFTTVTPEDVLKHKEIDVITEEQTVFGDANAHLSALDAHFAQRDGLMGKIECDLNKDGSSDRIYAVYNAAKHWDRDAQTTLNLPDGTLSLVTAEVCDEGVTLRFYVDNNFNSSSAKTECSYTDGELLINGYAYTYQEDIGVPFQKIGLVRLQSIYSYLSGEIKPWEQARVEISYPDDSNHRKMNLEIDGVTLYVHAEMDGDEVQLYELRVEPQDKSVPVIGDITTDHTAKQIIQALSLVKWEDYQSIPATENLNAVMGPYPLMSGTGEEAYECSVLWIMPDGEIYQLTMKLHEENLDTAPYCLTISSLNKPMVSVHELLLKTPEQVASMLSGYYERMSTSGEDIYAEGRIGDAVVEVHFEPLENQMVAQSIKVRFNEDTIDVFPGLKSTVSAEDAKHFLQPKMDWKLQRSESDGDIDRYYSTSFSYDKNTEAFWYATMITEYTWTAGDGYSEGAFGGLELSYSGEKDDADMAWYWTLYG